MRLGITAAALASTLILAGASAATATPLVNLQGAAGTAPGTIDLVRSPGGGRGGFGGISGGRAGGMAMRGGMGHVGKPGAMAMRGGGGHVGKPGAMAGRAYKGGGPSVYRGRGGNFAYKGGSRYKGGNYASRNYKGYRGNYAYNNYKGRGRHHRHYYPYFWPGLAWGGVGIYSGGYGGCAWLYRRAQASGSPYWWRRYQDCAYGYGY